MTTPCSSRTFLTRALLRKFFLVVFRKHTDSGHKVQHTWTNLHTIYTAPDICTQLDGKVLESDKCAFDFSKVDAGLIGIIEGVHTADDLCSALQGDWQGI
jgi:hypothetical protein